MKAASLCTLGLLALLAGCSEGQEYEPAQRTDSNQITLPAGADVEYKLWVLQGDTFTYTWSAPKPVTFDFHGEREGDRSGAFTSHKEGSLGADSGSHTAAFTGTHGWYWVNPHSDAVTINVRTEGVYDIVGEVAPSR